MIHNVLSVLGAIVHGFLHVLPVIATIVCVIVAYVIFSGVIRAALEHIVPGWNEGLRRAIAILWVIGVPLTLLAVGVLYVIYLPYAMHEGSRKAFSTLFTHMKSISKESVTR